MVLGFAALGCTDIHYTLFADVLFDAEAAAGVGSGMVTLWVEQPGGVRSSTLVVDLDPLPTEDTWFRKAMEGRQNECSGPSTRAWATLSFEDPATGEWVDAVTSEPAFAFDGIGVCGSYTAEVELILDQPAG
ncbi:MAG: hypothetical protein ABMA64_29165 [Myxococcota bacterium]